MVRVILSLIRNWLNRGAMSVVQSTAVSGTSICSQEGDIAFMCVLLLSDNLFLDESCSREIYLKPIVHLGTKSHPSDPHNQESGAK